MKPVTGPDLCHCLAARRLARYASRLYDRHLSAVGLSISQFSLLALIEQTPGIGIGELTAEMVMERTTTVRALRPLIDDGVVVAAREEGQKGHGYKLSPHGLALFQRAECCWKDAQAAYERHAGRSRAVAVRNEMLDLSGLR